MKQFQSQQRTGPTSTGYSPRSSGHGRKIASLRYLPSGLFIQLEVPYHKQFNETLKTSLPSKKRIWDNNDKAWYIVKDQFDKLVYILNQYFDETILLDFPPTDVATDVYSKLYLIEGAPLEVIQASYRALALKYHPDRGGNEEIMAGINVAYKELLGELTNGKESKNEKTHTT